MLISNYLNVPDIVGVSEDIGELVNALKHDGNLIGFKLNTNVKAEERLLEMIDRLGEASGTPEIPLD